VGCLRPPEERPRSDRRGGRADGATAFFFVPEDDATAASFARVAAELEQVPAPV
jgi:hypothetical protein